MALNLLWSLFFFGLRNPALGLLDIAVLLLVIVAYVITAWRVSRPAAILFIPYGLWVGFATLLNFEIWRLNG
jgi:tryptophan-rich sensory protein